VPVVWRMANRFLVVVCTMTSTTVCAITALTQGAFTPSAGNWARHPPSCQRRVYIDIGANWGTTLHLFENLAGLAGADPYAAPWEVYAFEASPLLQPHVADLCDWHSGRRETPPDVCLPNTGSLFHLVQWAPFYNCTPTEPHKLTTASYHRSAYECIVNKTLGALTALEPKFYDSYYVRECLQVAASPLQCGQMSSRFTLVPAAASDDDNARFHITSHPLQLLRGVMSGVADPSKKKWHRDVAARYQGKFKHPSHYVFNVSTVDVVGWILRHFHQDDLVILKMDIEGAEYPILKALKRRDAFRLLDVISLECHLDQRGYTEEQCRSGVARWQRLAALKGTALKVVFEEAHGGIDLRSSTPNSSDPVMFERVRQWIKACAERYPAP